MQGKVRIFFTYLLIAVVGVLIYLSFAFFMQKKPDVKNAKTETLPTEIPEITEANSTIAKPLDKELQEPIDMIESATNVIDDNKTASIDSTEDVNATQDSTNSVDSAVDSTNDMESFPRTFIVEANVLNVRSQPSVESPIIKRFKKGALISISGVEDTWAKLENGGWVLLKLIKEKQN